MYLDLPDRPEAVTTYINLAIIRSQQPTIQQSELESAHRQLLEQGRGAIDVKVPSGIIVLFRPGDFPLTQPDLALRSGLEHEWEALEQQGGMRVGKLWLPPYTGKQAVMKSLGDLPELEVALQALK